MTKDYMQYRACWNEWTRAKANGYLRKSTGRGALTNQDDAKMQVIQKRRAGYNAWLEDENGKRIKGV